MRHLLPKKAIKGHRGFTLIELVVCIAVIAVLAAIAVPSIVTAQKEARLARYDEHAKTVFLAAQTRLTAMRYSGELESVNTDPKNKPLTVDMLAAVPVNDGVDVRTLRLNMDKTIGTDAQILKNVLDDQIYDTSVLEASISVEYSAATGRIYAVCYSEDAKGFCYDSEISDGRLTNISDRSEDVRYERMFGYYGVDQLFNAEAYNDVQIAEAKLINDEYLYLKWQTVTTAELLGTEVESNFTVRLYSGAETTPCCEINVHSTDVKMHDGTQPLSYYDIGSGADKNCVYRDGNDYILVLDATDISSTSEHSITKRYPSIPLDGTMRAGVTVTPVGASIESEEMFSNYEHPLYTTYDKDGIALTLDDGQYGVGKARHFYNLRYGSDTGSYIQTQDIDYGKAYDDGFVTEGGQAVLHTPNDHLFPMQVFGLSNYAFRGLYDGSGYTLKNMNVMGVSGKPAGIFSTLEGANGWGGDTGKEGVKNLTLSGISVGTATGVEPSDGAGALAGVCTAEITGVTVKDSTVKGKNNVGGVVGKLSVGNKAVIDSTVCAENVTVEGIDRIGGVAGLMSYDGNNLRINAAFKNLVTPEGAGSVSGNEYVGGIVGKFENSISTAPGITLNALENQAKVNGSTYVGGIIGYNKKETLDNCINKGFVYSLAPTAMYIGGMTGYNGGTVKDCECIDSIIPQNIDVKTLMGTNVGGIAGYNYEGVSNANFGVIKNCEFSGTVAGKKNVGGIVGNNASAQTNSLVECKTTGGTVYGTGIGADSINTGGIVGLNAGVLISGHDNAANVLGSKYAGGIVGNNGTGRTIKNCTNTGAVVSSVQYGGGITGSNLGTIENCRTNTPDPSDELKEELVGWALGSDIGGIAGYNEGTVKITGSEKIDCRAIVAGVDNIGGIVGFNTGTVRGYRLTGGQVLATGDCVGGFFGLNTSRASLSSAGGTGAQDQTQAVFETNELYASPSLVEGVRFVGGVVGCNLVEADAQGTVAFACTNGKDADTAGTVRARSFAGGIMGYNGIVESAAASAVTTALTKLKTDTKTVYDYDYPAESATTSNKLTYIAYSKNYMGVEAKEYIGGIIGLNSSASKLTVTNCINCGKLKTTEKKTNVLDYYIGGITGRNSVSGKIEYCENLGSVTSHSRYVGGLVEVNEGEISYCKLSGTISADKASSTGTGATGGAAGLNGSSSLASINSRAKIIYCTATDTASVSSTGSSVGGIAGDNRAQISNISASGGVSGTNNVGGVIGYNAPDASVSSIATGSHSSNTVACTSTTGCVGGVIGYNAGNSSNLINRLNVSGAGWYTGGVVGNHAGTSITNCSNYGTVYSSSAAYNYNSYAGGTAANSAYAGGITAYNAVGVTVSGCSNSGNVTGNASFTGGITGLNRGTIENCEALGGTINGAGSGSSSKYVGGIAGENAATGIITHTGTGYTELKSNINATGSGTFDVGGLLGINKNKDCIISRYNYAGAIYASSRSVNAGGIIGRNDMGSIVDDCILTGSLNTPNSGSNIGGIVGVNRGTVQNITLNRTAAAVKVVGGNSTVTGGVVGSNNKDCLVINVSIGADSLADATKFPLEVSGGHAGGVVGKNTGNIENAISYAKVKGNSAAGGIFGTTPSNKADVSSFTLKTVKNYGAVTGNTITGGIAGIITCGNVTTDIRLEDCENYGTVNGTSTGGIIGKSDSGASSNIVLTDCINAAQGNVTGKNHAGGAIGWSIGKADLERCKNLGNVSGNNSATVGGIIGLAEGTNGGKTLTDCENSGVVVGIKEVGGIVGESKSRISIKNCKACTGSSVTGTGNAGGIIGRLTGVSGSTVEDCMVESGAVITGGSSSNKSVGGIAGYASNVTVKHCTNNAALTSPYRAGGIVGFDAAGTVIETCTNSAAIIANERAGGIVAVCENTVGRIVNCENTGAITSNAYAGGIAGERTKLSGTSTFGVTDCVNSGEVSTLGAGGAAGGIFGNIDGKSAVSIVNCTNSGVVSAAQKYAGGIVGSIASDGASSAPVHRIESCSNIGTIGCNASAAVQSIGGIAGSAYSTLVSATDNSGSVSASSTGSSVTRVGGITGASGNMGSTVADCTNSGAIVVNGTSAQYIGGICGELCATAISNKNTGTLNAANANCVGGIAGAMTNVNGRPVIINSSVNNFTESRGAITVTGANLHSIGGIAGSCINGSVISAYAEGDISVEDVNAQSKVGGVVGYLVSNGTEEIKNSYFAGQILPLTVSTFDSYRGGIIGELETASISTAAVADAGYVEAGVPETQITADMTLKKRAIGNFGDWSAFGITTAANAAEAYTRVGSYSAYQLQPQTDLRVEPVPNSAAYTISWDYPAGHVGGYTLTAYLKENDALLEEAFHSDDPNVLSCTYTPDEDYAGEEFYLKIVNRGIPGLSTDSEMTRSSGDYTIYATLPKPGAPTWVYKSSNGTNSTYTFTYTKAQFEAVYNTTELRNAVKELVLTYNGADTVMAKQPSGDYKADITFDFEDESLYTKNFPLTLKAVAKEPVGTYIYYSSGATSFTLNAYRPEKLSVPTLDELIYTGTMSDPNKYDVTINKVTGASKYVIKLYEGDGDTPVETDTVDSSDASTYTVHYTSSDFNDETAQYKVSAQAQYTGTDGRYLNSDEEMIASFNLPTKLATVEKITVTLSERSHPSYPSYVVSWSDAGTSDKFEVHIDMEDTTSSLTVEDVYLQNGSASPEKTNTTLNIVTYFGQTMKIKVKKLGVPGITVDSNYKTLEFVIPPRLAGIAEVTVYRDSSVTSVVHAAWTLPDTVTAANCSAVQVYTVNDANVHTPVKLVSVTDAPHMTVTFTDVGSTRVAVMPVGKDGVAFDGAVSTPAEILLTQTMLEKPKSVAAVTSTDAGTVRAVVNFEPSDNVLMQAFTAGYTVQLLDGSNTVIAEQTLEPNVRTYTFTNVPTALKVRVKANAQSGGVFTGSDWAVAAVSAGGTP